MDSLDSRFHRPDSLNSYDFTGEISFVDRTLFSQRTALKQYYSLVVFNFTRRDCRFT